MGVSAPPGPHREGWSLAGSMPGPADRPYCLVRSEHLFVIQCSTPVLLMQAEIASLPACLKTENVKNMSKKAAKKRFCACNCKDRKKDAKINPIPASGFSMHMILSAACGSGSEHFRKETPQAGPGVWLRGSGAAHAGAS